MCLGRGKCTPSPTELGCWDGKGGESCKPGEKELGAWDSHALSPALGHIARSWVPGNWDSTTLPSPGHPVLAAESRRRALGVKRRTPGDRRRRYRTVRGSPRAPEG